MVDGRITAHDGVPLAYRDHGGGGRGLVLLHGGGANLVSMDQYAARLGAGRRTVSMDARACGRSGDPAHVRLIDMAEDVRTLTRELHLGPVDVVGHSMGGFVAGFYAGLVDDARVVSIDGFGPGTVALGDEEGRDRFRRFQSDVRAAFRAMTAPPEHGDRAWRDRQVDALVEILPTTGYTAPNGRELAERNFVELDDGRFRRHPARQLFEDVFGDDAELDVLRMYRDVRCPTMIIRCERSGAPPVLDDELAALERANPRVRVERLDTTHLGPAWDALEDTAALVERFFAQTPTSG
jgi:pimeloyl-ACP methyl ester carboxylesterase